MSLEAFLPSNGIKYGVAYYPEYHVSDRLIQDLDLMIEAGINVIRVGESVWSTWEPRDGEFNLEWMDAVLDAAYERQIEVVFGTPTYAIPPWLQVAEPAIAGEVKTGQSIPWGGRQEMDFTHPTFRLHAERVIRKLMERFAKHPAVVGYQVDNEPGLHLFHNDRVFQGFLEYLKEKYGDVETINREWGLTYWSHLLNDWSELWRPDGNTFPQYDLAWRNYQAELTTEFIGWQAEIVREYKTDAQFVTTCIQYQQRPALNDMELSKNLEVTSGNPYYGMQDRLSIENREEALTDWTTSGVASLLRQADRLFSSKQHRFLVTETNAQAISGSSMNHPPYPGQLKQSAFALISRGAAMVEYWHWHTLPYGTETYWGGVLPHSLVPGRVYSEVSDIGNSLKKVGPVLDGFVPDSDIAIMWDNESKFAMEFMPPLAKDGQGDKRSYENIVDAFHAGITHSGQQARFMHAEQAASMGSESLAKAHPVLVVAGFYVARDEHLQLLNDYVKAGGHLVLGPRTAYADEEARARIEVSPSRLTDVSGVRYEEFSNISNPIKVDSSSGELELDASAAAESWIDGLILEGGVALATYDHPHFGKFPAVTTHDSGKGRVTTVGCVPSVSLASSVMRWASTSSEASKLTSDTPDQVLISSGTAKQNAKIWFVFNWGWESREVKLETGVRDLISDEEFSSGTKISLASWSTRMFTST